VRPELFGVGLVAALAGGLLAFRSHSGPYVGAPDDFMQISQLYARYNHALDTHDAERFVQVFAPDGVFRDPSWCAKRPAELAKIAVCPVAPNAVQKLHHAPSLGPITYQDRNHATAHSTVMVAPETGGGVQGGGIRITGTYDDTLVRIKGRWVFKYRWVHRPSLTPAVACEGP